MYHCLDHIIHAIIIAYEHAVLLLICNMLYSQQNFHNRNICGEHVQVICGSTWYCWQLSATLKSMLSNEVKQFDPKVFSSVFTICKPR